MYIRIVVNKGPNRIQALFLLLVALSCAGRGFAGVAVTEIMYHPVSEDDRDEYIEIKNTGSQLVDLTGWRFTEGISFVFQEGMIMPPGGRLVVAADPERLRSLFGLDRGSVAGPWNGSLSNSGERITLADHRGAVADTVAYDDEPPWPLEADGGGASLECINAALDNDTPRNWSGARPSWFHVSYTGSATSNKLILYLAGPGSCLLDDVTLTPVEGGPTQIPNGAFTRGIEGWSARGSHSGSVFSPQGGRSDPGCLKILATDAGNGSSNGITCYPDPPLKRGKEYRLSFYVLHLSGSRRLITRLSGGGLEHQVEIPPGSGTPGRPNSIEQEVLPPLVASVEVEPVLPFPRDRPIVRARVEADGPCKVILQYYSDGWHETELADDGSAPGDEPGDGVYAAVLPSFPAGTLVRLKLTAQAGDLLSRPFESGFGVASEHVDSKLPVFWLFVRPADWRYLNENIWTQEYVPALLVAGGKIYPQVGLRFRGGRPRLFRKKSLKLRLQHGLLEGRRVVNLNAAAMDDDYMTEPLAYDFYRWCGVPAGETRFVRVQLNGSFWGLFVDVEQVDEKYLECRGIPPGGALYKAVGIASNLSPLEETQYTYEEQYEKKTRRSEPYDDLIEFIHGLAETDDPELFLEENLEVELFARYLAATNLMCVWDAIQHNYYLYRPPGGRWLVIPWDLDHAWGEWEWVYYCGNTYPLLMGHRDHRFAGVWYTWNNLWTVFFDVPRFRRMYEDFIREFLNTTFTEWRIFPRIENYRELIEETVLLDEAAWPDSKEPQHTGPQRTMAQELPLLKKNVSCRRRYLAGLLGVELMEQPPELFVRGEANADGKLNVADAVAVLEYLFSGGSVPCLAAADVNDDEQINIADAVALLGFLFAGGSQPPEPFEACGTDPTAGPLDCAHYPPCR